METLNEVQLVGEQFQVPWEKSLACKCMEIKSSFKSSHSM